MTKRASEGSHSGFEPHVMSHQKSKTGCQLPHIEEKCPPISFLFLKGAPSILELKRELTDKDGEISELKVRMDELHSANKREAKTKDEMQDHYQRRIREKQAELEQYRV